MSAASEDGLEDFRLDRSQFSVVRLADPDDAVEYWLSRPVEERLRALELLRRTFYGYTSASATNNFSISSSQAAICSWYCWYICRDCFSVKRCSPRQLPFSDLRIVSSLALICGSRSFANSSGSRCPLTIASTMANPVNPVMSLIT